MPTENSHQVGKIAPQQAEFLMTPEQHRRRAQNMRDAGRPDLAKQHENLAKAIEYRGQQGRKTRPPTEAAYASLLRMSLNTCSHKISGLRSPALASATSFVAIDCLTSSSQSPVRRAMQTISSATLRTRLLSWSNRSPLRNGVIGMARSLGPQAGARPVSQPPTPGAMPQSVMLEQYSVNNTLSVCY
jgi:hypothetical protein